MNGWSFARWLIVVGFLASTAPLSGCGGSSGPPNCLQEQPCGGDVGGTWSFLGVCSNVSFENQQLQAACPGRSIGGLGASLTGQITFNPSDMTYTAANWHEMFSATETLPLSCLDGATSCAALSGTTTDTSTGTAVTTTVTCSGTTVCTCHVAGNLTLATAETAAYTIAGTNLVLSGTETSGNFGYCVEGNRLHMMTLETNAAMPLGPEVITSDVVAMKQ
jgi:hypothetical protein